MVKWAKWLIGGTVAAGATAAIAVPITLSVRNKKVAVVSLNPGANAYKGVDGKMQSVTKITVETEAKLKASSSLVGDLNDAAAYFYYDLEQKGSIKAQIVSFESKITDKYIAKADLSKPSSTIAAAEKTKQEDRIDKEIADIRKKILVINNSLKTSNPTPLNYDSSSFKSDYPTILIPVSKMVKDSVKALKEEKEQHIKMFKTRAAGIADWHKVLINKYKSSTTKKVAKAKTLLRIKSTALSSFQVSLMSKSIKHMEKVKYTEDGKATTNLVFPQFKNVVEKGKYLREHKDYKIAFEDTDSIYYLGTKSFIKNREVIFYRGYEKSTTTVIPENKFRDDVIARLANQGIADFKHAIIPFIPNQENNANLWTLKPMKKNKVSVVAKRKALLSMIEKTNGREINFKNVDKLFIEDEIKGGKSDDANLKATNLYLKTINEGGNAASHGGTLNMGPFMKFLSDSAKDYDKEFIMGTLIALASTKTIPGQNIPVKIPKGMMGGTKQGDAIIAEISKAVNKIPAALKLNTTSTATLKTSLDGISEDKIDIVIGQKIKQAIEDSGATSIDGSLKHVYQLSKDSKGGKRFIIISNFGIHIITWQDFSKQKGIADQMELDFKKMNDKQTATGTKLPYNNLFGSIFTDVSKVKYMMNNLDFIKFLKKQDALPTDSEMRWYKEQKDSTGKTKINVDDIKIEIIKQNTDHDDLEKMGMVTKIFTQTFVNGILDKYDKELRDPTGAKISDLFAITLKAGGL